MHHQAQILINAREHHGHGVRNLPAAQPAVSYSDALGGIFWRTARLESWKVECKAGALKRRRAGSTLAGGGAMFLNEVGEYSPENPNRPVAYATGAGIRVWVAISHSS